MTTFTVSLDIPKNRKGVETWISNQDSNTIADIFEHSQFFFKAIATKQQNDAIQSVIKEKDAEINRLSSSKTELMQKLAEEEKRIHADTSKEYSYKITEYEKQIAILTSQLTILNNQMLDLQNQKSELFTKNEQLHEEKLQLAQTNADEIKNLTKSLTGTSANIGSVGEEFVKHKMTSMNLGTYDDDSTNKNSGFADGTWKYTYTSKKVPQICCLVEVKNKKKLEKERDFDKFEKIDVPTAHNAGRINMAMFISLIERISGKDWISFETKLGVPTLWISRNAEDCLSADTLIDVAFRTMVQIWPTISQQSHTDVESTLNKVAIHIETQLREIEMLSKQISEIEKTGHALVKKATNMKKISENLENNLMNIRMSDNRLSVHNTNSDSYDFWSQEGETLLQALRAFHTNKKRHASRLEDLKDLDTNVVQKILSVPNCFKDAIEKVKNESQQAAGLKRQQAKIQTANKKHKKDE